MAKTIKVRFTPGIVELLEKARIPHGAELTVIFEDKNDEAKGQPKIKCRWARVARKMSEENLLAGMEADFFQWSQEFRDNFVFNDTFINENENE
ncbi:MAG: hypothetical protein HQK96_15110 [Nitrospirae bacterium]|nr:hypothetical protein [Nitrospirota bacterium]